MPADDRDQLTHRHGGHLRDADRISHQHAAFRVRPFHLDLRLELAQDPLADVAKVFPTRAQVRVVEAVEDSGMVRDRVAPRAGRPASGPDSFDRLLHELAAAEQRDVDVEDLADFAGNGFG
jgi:hypothetical protein